MNDILNTVFIYVVCPIITIWVSFITLKVVKIDRRFILVEKLVSLIDFDKVPKNKNFNNLFKTLEG